MVARCPGGEPAAGISKKEKTLKFKHMSLYMVKQYKAKLVPEMMEQAIKTIKTRFQKSLAAELDLRRVTAPLFVLSGTGINDDLNGVER